VINRIQKEAKERMSKSIHALEEALSRRRTGRAHPNLLENIMVSYYGQDTPLSQLAAIHVESALMLAVKPWEKRLVPEIEKAIRASDLGLNPSTAGDVIRVPLPPLSEERRKELIKQVKGECEEAKVAIRNIRRDSNQQIKELLKAKSISEDEQRQSEETIQKTTDDFIQQIDKIAAHKEKDLMVI